MDLNVYCVEVLACYNELDSHDGTLRGMVSLTNDGVAEALLPGGAEIDMELP